MEIVSKTILRQIITQCTGTQDIVKKLASCDPRGRKRGLKTVAFLLRLSIYYILENGHAPGDLPGGAIFVHRAIV